MKKLLLLFIGLLAIPGLQAQDITDAYRYSSEELTGTARFRAMSGAFGALGGDMSAIGTNPASSAVFLSSLATITLDHRNSENSVNYFNGLTEGGNRDFNVNQAGGVLIFNAANNSPWRKFSFGINFSTTNNFDDSFVAAGTGTSSIGDYFLNYANGVRLEDLEVYSDENISDRYAVVGEELGFGAQQAFLGYQGFILDPAEEDIDNTSYTSLTASEGNGAYDQDYSFYSTGLNGKFTFNFGAQYQDFLYLGANLNTHFLNYSSSSDLIESNSNSGSETNYVRFRNDLSTNGDGFSFQLGAITKLNERLRLGASYESPTWYTIREENAQILNTRHTAEGNITVNPNIVNIYPDYKLKTPGKLTGSLAVLFGSKGLISFDYSYKDFSKTEFRPTNDPDFRGLNADINDNLKAVSSYKVGGEYRIAQWSLRGGYRYEESPYADENTIGALNSYSAGLGYDFGNMKFDLAYVNTQYDENRPLYQVGLTDQANINRNLSNIVLSLSFGL